MQLCKPVGVTGDFFTHGHVKSGRSRFPARNHYCATICSISVEKNLIGVASSYVPDVEGIVATVAVAQELGFSPSKDIDLPTYAKKFENTALAKEVLAKRP